MRKYLFAGILILLSLNLPAQVLEGYWVGKYNYSDSKKSSVDIDIRFALSNTGAYEVYSYTHQLFGLFTDTCKVFYRALGSDSFYLEEIAEDDYDNRCQVMFLKLEQQRNHLFLRGRWAMADPGIPDSGEIFFRKKAGKRKRKK